MPVIGAYLLLRLRRVRRFVEFGIILEALAQRTKWRKTSYLDACHALTDLGKHRFSP
jgi:hypothetical protein